MKVAVLGTGSWGTALAQVLTENKLEVLLWGREEESVNEINEEHRNHHYLGDHLLPKDLKATTNLEEALQDAEMILIVIPTKGVREVCGRVNAILKDSNSASKPIVVHATKGLEAQTHYRISQVIEESLDSAVYDSIVVLSGPSHAEEVARHDLTSITAASTNMVAAKLVQQAFMNGYFRIYTNQDVVGVEMGAALKNIIAVCAGLIAGAGYGDNAKAALLTRGLAEISRLGIQLGADPLTFAGLSGVGDLVVTCTSPHSRNWQAGQWLAKGYTMAETIKKVEMVVEGFSTCAVAYELAQQMGVDMPITTALYRILYENKQVKECLAELMMRDGKQEASLANHMQ